MKFIPCTRSVCLAALRAFAAGSARDGPGRACGRANPQFPIPASTAQLLAGDSLTVALRSVPNRSTHSVQIDAQGLISLPCSGTLAAAGVRTADLSRRIRKT